MPQTNPASTEVPARGRHRRGDVVAPETPAAFEPRHTVRCVGEARFRSQAARDLGCLLDLDGDVLEWRCLPEPLAEGGQTFLLDVEARRHGAVELIALVSGDVVVPAWAERVAADLGARLRVVPVADLAGHRLENARELMRYARWRVSLSDRIRILAALDAEGSLTLVECMSAIRNAADPIGAVAALCLRRFVEIDLDSGPLGPETRVIRFRG